MTTVTLRAPARTSGQIQTPFGNVAIAADSSAVVDSRAVTALLGAGFTYWRGGVGETVLLAPAAADLVSVSDAAALTVNGARTLAAQPDYARKLQVRLVRASGSITAGILTIVGTAANGAPISEAVSLVTGASVTIKTVNAFAHVTSATVSAIAGTFSMTLGVGVAADLAVQTPPGSTDLVVYKETVASSVADAWTVADEAVGTVDAVAGTVAPTTPADGAHHFRFAFAFNT